MPPLPDSLPGLIGLDHIGLAVPDLDAAIAWHVRVLGLTVLLREANDEQEVLEALLGVPGQAPDAPAVQLLAATRSGSVIGRFLASSGPGLHHVAYRVVELERAVRVLRREGLRLLYDAPRIGSRRSLINFVHPRDAGGVLIELVEPAPQDHRTGMPAAAWGH